MKLEIKKQLWYLVGWMFLLVLGNVIWLSLDKNTPAWDQAAHLRGVIMAREWMRESFSTFAKATADKGGNFGELIKSFGGYPPLIYFMGAVWSWIAGVSIAKITFLNTLFLAAAMVGVYKLAGKKILPVILFSLFPVIYDISRNMLLDLPLTVWVIWGLYFWMKKNEGGMLLMLILASLTKLNGFLYFGPIVLMMIGENYKNKEFWMRAVIGAAIYSVAVGWWWGINGHNIYEYLTGLAGSGEKLTDPMNLLDWRTWIHYFRLFLVTQVGPVTALVFLIFGKKENKKLIWWTVLTYVIFTIIKNKDFRFTMPILAVVAVWLGSILPSGVDQGLTGDPPLTSRVRQVLVGFLLLWMGVNYVENSFNWPWKKPMIVSTPTFLLGDINWINFSEYPVREFRREVWPQKEIMSQIEDGKGRSVMVAMLMNQAELNDNNLMLEMEMENRHSIEIHGIYQWGEMDFDYIVVPDLNTQSAPFYDVMLTARTEAIRQVWNNIDQYQIVGEYNLPRGGKVYLLTTKNPQ